MRVLHRRAVVRAAPAHARCRRDPHRPDRRRHGLQALAGERRRQEPVLGRTTEGQAFGRRRSVPARGAPARGRPHHRTGPRRRRVRHQLSAGRVPRPRGAAQASRRPDHRARARLARRRAGRGLHGQRVARRAPDDRLRRPWRRAGQPRAAGLGPADRRVCRLRRAGGRAPSHAHGPRAGGDGAVVGRRAGVAGPHGAGRRGAHQR